MALKLVCVQYFLFSIIVQFNFTERKPKNKKWGRPGNEARHALSSSIANAYAYKAVDWYVAIINVGRYK